MTYKLKAEIAALGHAGVTVDITNKNAANGGNSTLWDNALAFCSTVYSLTPNLRLWSKCSGN